MLSRRTTATLIAGFALSGLVACADNPALLDAAALTPLLLTAEETGLPGSVTRTLNEGEDMPTQLPLAMPVPGLEQPCEGALQAGLETRFLPHASASAGYAAAEGRLELGLFSVSEEIDVRGIYEGIIADCAGPVHDPNYGATYFVRPLDSEYPGMRVSIDLGKGRTHEAIVIQAEVDNHWVLVGAQRMSGEEVEEIVATQVAKLEEGLGGKLRRDS